MITRSFLRVSTVFVVALALGACSRSESYRYKLTLAVNTPAGVKRAASVAELRVWDFYFPERGYGHQLRGEALYLDLGPGARPLIALLTSHRPSPCVTCPENIWTLDGGPSKRLMSSQYGIAPSTDFNDYMARVARLRGPHSITPNDLPDLVTFADVNDPKTVIEIDPNHLPATLGPGVSWNEITVESTYEPTTSGIRTKLPWLPAYFQRNLKLDGSHMYYKNELANQLSWYEFDQSGDLKQNPCDPTKADNPCSP